MGRVVLHLDKSPGNETKMTAHIERTQMPANANPELTHLNRELIEFPDGVANRTEAIQYRLDNAGLTRKIGTNQVRAIRIMLTGTNEDMKRIEADGKLDQWCNDNLNWLRNTYRSDNLVSAVLHLDEATPHIHATVVPIVTGERRKAKEKKDQPGKKKYRKKNPNAVRLCVDDVMTRINLKHFQDTYAEAMKKYGLERGIDGSEARHITTQEFYRNAIAQKENLQEDISILLQVEESKRQAVEDLKQKEQEALTNYQQADTLKQKKEDELSKTESELKQVKGQLKTEKFKSTAAEAGSAIMDGISSALGTSKVKRQQQEIESLKDENQNLRQDITGLNQQVGRMHQEIQTKQKEHESAIDKLKKELDKIHIQFPLIREIFRIESLCRVLKFSEVTIRRILTLEPVSFKGELYSPEYKREFKTNGSIAEIKPHPTDQTKLRLTIDGETDTIWFRQKNKEFLERLGIKVPEGKKKQGQSF